MVEKEDATRPVPGAAAAPGPAVRRRAARPWLLWAVFALAVAGAGALVAVPRPPAVQAVLFLLACPVCAYLGVRLMNPLPPDER